MTGRLEVLRMLNLPVTVVYYQEIDGALSAQANMEIPRKRGGLAGGFRREVESVVRSALLVGGGFLCRIIRFMLQVPVRFFVGRE